MTIGYELSPDRVAGMHDTLSDRVTAELHRLILIGELPAGSPLPIQSLAERFSTSAMPVREALRRLASLGLVDIAAHRGARVRDLTVADLEDTYRMRLTLEPLAVSLAAERSEESVAQLAEDALDRHEQHLGAGALEDARRAHTDFHFSLYRGSGSRWLVRAIEPVWQNSERYRFSAHRGDSDPHRSHAEHMHILKAYRASDAVAAELAMREHLQGAMTRMQAAISQN
ncbi:GntR family transcriptional regulator [Georgenia yuyongxinii]